MVTASVIHLAKSAVIKRCRRSIASLSTRSAKNCMSSGHALPVPLKTYWSIASPGRQRRSGWRSCHFRLQHLYLRQVAAGAGSQRGRSAEGINLRQRTGVGFAVQLAGTVRERLLPKKSLSKSTCPDRYARQVFCGSSVGQCGTFRRRSVSECASAEWKPEEEAPFVEEAVQRLRRGVTHGYRANQAGADAGATSRRYRCCGAWPPSGRCPVFHQPVTSTLVA